MHQYFSQVAATARAPPELPAEGAVAEAAAEHRASSQSFSALKACREVAREPKARAAQVPVLESSREGVSSDDYEHCKAHLDAAHSEGRRRADELRDFRREQRLLAPAEDPLELLEWKAPREDRTSWNSFAVRALLGLRSKRARGSAATASERAASASAPLSTGGPPEAAQPRVDLASCAVGAYGLDRVVGASTALHAARTGCGLLEAYASDSDSNSSASEQ